MSRYRVLAFAILLLGNGESRAQPSQSALKHYVFVGRDRERLADSAFIGKRLWIQLQDVSFSVGVRVIPDYLYDDPAFSGGGANQYEDDSARTQFVGQMARRWDPAVRERFATLLDTLGRAFDGKIEGLNFAETSFSLSARDTVRPAGFTYDGYARAIRSMMSSARSAFRRSHVMVYANFMPGEWLPGDDRGYLRGIYAYADSIGVGGPDLLPGRRVRALCHRFVATQLSILGP